ncbi:MAG: methyltransferase domain-containing protein [Nocardioidaceae bacterium]
MKYDAEIDPGNPNTSHAIVLDLVGSGQRVLDVGCSTGYLAAALAARGNDVSGVELDLAAAEHARPHLKELVVGDLEELDLVAAFGKRSFDVLVFADVLEHLRNPGDVLRRAVPLLDRGGSAVISIPNVAHGAVRLALLQGHFDYSEMGLLDDTHLRFYTRESVDELLRTSGFACMELRRTTAGPFETEIRLDAGSVSQQVLETLDQDPESTTYQFVLRAAPVDYLSDAVLESLPSVQLAKVQGELSALARGAAGAHSPIVGIASTSGELLDDLRAAVVHAELRRRLDGFRFRLLALAKTDNRAPYGFGGEPLHLLADFATATATRVATEADALVLVGPLGAADMPGELDAFVARLDEEGCPVHVVCSTDPGLRPPTWLLAPCRKPSAVLIGAASALHLGTVTGLPDVLVLADHLAAPLDLESRLDYLRAIGTLPDGPYLAVHADPEHDTDQLALEHSTASVARQIGCSVVTLGDGPFSDVQEPLDAVGLDLLATIAGASLVVTDQPGLLAAGAALCRPRVGLHLGSEPPGGDSGATPVALLGDLPAVASLAGGSVPGNELSRDAVRAHFDNLAAALRLDTAGAMCRSAAAQLADLRDRVATVEATNYALRGSIAREREELAKRWSGVPGDARATPAETWAAKLTAEEGLRQAVAELASVHAELAALQSTFTLRTLRPARRLYGKLRFRR